MARGRRDGGCGGGVGGTCSGGVGGGGMGGVGGVGGDDGGGGKGSDDKSGGDVTVSVLWRASSSLADNCQMSLIPESLERAWLSSTPSRSCLAEATSFEALGIFGRFAFLVNGEKTKSMAMMHMMPVLHMLPLLLSNARQARACVSFSRSAGPVASSPNEKYAVTILRRAARRRTAKAFSY